jgi:putative heme transporter
MGKETLTSERSTEATELEGALASHDAEEMPRVHVTRRNTLLFAVFVVAAIAFLYFVLPQLSGLERTWERINEGNSWWLAVALGLTALSFGGYVALFQGVYVDPGSRIGWSASYQITMAGLAATRLFAAAGAGGVILTAWALRRSGMRPREVASRTVTFLVLMYAVYMLALLVGGIGLRTGLLPGPAPLAMTVVPAAFAGTAFVLALAMALVPDDFERRLRSWASGHGRAGGLARRLAPVPSAVAGGVRGAIAHLRAHDPAVLGAFAYWTFNIGILWACFQAFGEAPPAAVIVMGYFVGMLGNTLPLPGGVGGVDGGMIGAFLAFGVDGGLAVVAVLAYRAFAFWLPTVPGAIAYFQLRRTVARWRRAPEMAGPAA